MKDKPLRGDHEPETAAISRREIAKSDRKRGDHFEMGPTNRACFCSNLVSPAAVAAVALEAVREKYVEQPKKLLLDELRKGNVQNLSAEQLAPLLPMTYKFLEAAKEGEYERNLRVLAAFLRGELEQEEPDAANFARMARRWFPRPILQIR